MKLMLIPSYPFATAPLFSIGLQDNINSPRSIAFSMVAGTYVERKMEQFMTSSASNKTDIDALVLFEQRVNLMNCPIILLQMARVLVPVELTNRYRVVHLVR